MKFTFDTTYKNDRANYKNNKYEIKLSIGEGISTSSTLISIGYDDTFIKDEDKIENAIKTVLDNTRFTVKEREIAENEAIRFIGYLRNEINVINPQAQSIYINDDIIDIFEDNEEQHKIDDEALLDEK